MRAKAHGARDLARIYYIGPADMAKPDRVGYGVRGLGSKQSKVLPAELTDIDHASRYRRLPSG